MKLDLVLPKEKDYIQIWKPLAQEIIIYKEKSEK